jgi:hypothetical protein
MERPQGQMAAMRLWLRRVVAPVMVSPCRQMVMQRLTLSQHREILTLGGWIALLIANARRAFRGRGRAQ